MTDNETKNITPTVTEDPTDILARLRADALLAVATDAAANMQLERLSKGRRKAGWREARAVSGTQGADIIHSLAVLATSHNPTKVSSVARRHWNHARGALRDCRRIKDKTL